MASDSAVAKLQLAFAHLENAQHDTAEALCNEALAIHPQYPDALHLLALIAIATSRRPMAVELLKNVTALDSGNAAAWCNLGSVFRELDQWDGALVSYERALAIDASFAGAEYNRSTVLHQLGRFDDALASCNRAIALDPNLADAYLGRSALLLLKGDFARGLVDYEWRLKGSIASRGFVQPRWLGVESIAGKTILLSCEQGFGDVLQFCRYAKAVSALQARVILEAQKPLVRLLRSADGASSVVAVGDSLPAFDVHCPLPSLPLAFGTRLDTIPTVTKYLSAEPEKIARWSMTLGERTRPRVGLVWRGNQVPDRNRSIPLAHLLQKLPAGIQYVSLQKDLPDSERQLLASTDLPVAVVELGDFDDTAALCECLDVVISIDTSVAHLSGALGRTTWILLPFSPDWRWLLNRDDSPWYRMAKLYRQPTLGDWDSVLDRVRTDLLQRAF